MDFAIVGGRLADGLEEVTSDLSVLDGRGRWVVVLPFEGAPLCARFARWRAAPAPVSAPAENPVPVGGWTSSLCRAEFMAGVEAVRSGIAAGDVYQVNLCRRLSAPLPSRFGFRSFASSLLATHPAPHAAVVHLPSAGVWVASASPERFLSRSGRLVVSQPIKGTSASAAALAASAKDRAENVMIVDLVRNDLGRVCEYGSVAVDALCAVEAHPGLFHLVSTVSGRLRAGVGWPALLAACFPPGSVTGAPKLAALEWIRRLEPVSRSVYCGAVGWVDADRGEGDLNVAIRTFWMEDGRLHFGVGGGVTWDSTPEGEWEETELKARRLLAVAGRTAVA